MKKVLAGLLALLCICLPALAEGDDYWTDNAGLYYHTSPLCGGMDSRVPISAKAAEAFGKHSCPVCVSAGDEGKAPQAVARGGTIVVKFSDAWLAEHELSGVFGFMGVERYAGVQAYRLLGKYLHGEAYNAFLQAWMNGETAEGRAITPYILPSDGTLVMNSRHIGSAWYIIVRPREKFSDKWNMYWRISSYALHAEEENLYSEFDLQTVEDHLSLKLGGMGDSKSVYSRKEAGLSIEVYRALDGNIAVLREDKPTGTLENVQLIIGGRNGGIELSGYIDGASAVYCCALTEAELEQLQNNTRMEIRRTETVNSAIYRVIGDGDYDYYYSRSSDELLASIGKLNGLDPVDGNFRHIYSGSEPDRFVLYGADTCEICRFTETGMETVYPDYTKEEIRAERITPLVWYDEKAVFLMENHKYQDYTPEDRLFIYEIAYGQRIGSGPEDEFGSYACWLADENGNAITGMKNQAFTILEDGRICLEDFEGNAHFYGPFADD